MNKCELETLLNYSSIKHHTSIAGHDILSWQTILVFENQFRAFPSCSILPIETNIKNATYKRTL
jgi:hypothetical protein